MSQKTQQKQTWALASIKMQDAYTDFMLSRQAMLCTDGTMGFYQYTLGKFLKWIEDQGVISPDEVNARYVRAYLAEMSGYSDTTLHGLARAVKTLLRFWYDEGYLAQPVKFAMPRLSSKRLPCLDVDQLKKVLKACIKPRDKALIMLLADSGLRRSEALALNWDDLDIQSGLVRVKRGKGGKARSVVIGATTRRALLSYSRTLKNRDDDSPLIQTDEGTRLSKPGLRSALLRVGKRAGIHVSPHMLRRTFATLSLRAGMDVLHLQALLGHAGLEMVQHYAQMIDDDLLKEHKKHSPIDNL